MPTRAQRWGAAPRRILCASRTRQRYRSATSAHGGSSSWQTSARTTASRERTRQHTGLAVIAPRSVEVCRAAQRSARGRRTLSRCSGMRAICWPSPRRRTARVSSGSSFRRFIRQRSAAGRRSLLQHWHEIGPLTQRSRSRPCATPRTPGTAVAPKATPPHCERQRQGRRSTSPVQPRVAVAQVGPRDDPLPQAVRHLRVIPIGDRHSERSIQSEPRLQSDAVAVRDAGGF